MRTGNPAMNAKVFERFDVFEPTRTMTVEGTTIKTAILLLLAVLTAGFSWSQFATGGLAAAMPWMIGGGIGGLVLAIATIFKPTWAPVTAPGYALAEGLFLGGISAWFNERFFEGIAIQAIGLTMGTLLTMLICYRAGWIRATEKFKAGIFAATGGICLVYLASFVLGMFGTTIPYIHSSGLIGIGFSLFVVVIAALNLILDFDFIEKGAQAQAPKFMEWYGAFGLMLTLVWLYLEILRLLAKLSSRD